jgi:catechol 2,3-dioxygenase-like lactoylglutathione lyase family enzyme
VTFWYPFVERIAAAANLILTGRGRYQGVIDMALGARSHLELRRLPAQGPKPEELGMSSTPPSTDSGLKTSRPEVVDMKLEVVVIPVSDVERAKHFYGDLGWRLDADVTKSTIRIVQFTPPGSSCSIQFGAGLTASAAGCTQSVYLVVSDIEAARAALSTRGVDTSEVFHRGGPKGRLSGPDPAHASYASFVSFSDPDGNSWLVQEVTARLPGRVDADATTFNSPAELAGALRRAEAAHAEHEKRTGKPDANWADWYAEFIVRAQGGRELPI